MVKRILKWVLYFILLIFVSIILLLWALFSGGRPFEDRSTAPLLLVPPETVVTLSEPPGNIAVSQDGRIFLTIHPESRPNELKVIEIVQGKPKAFPNDATQRDLFQAPQGIRIDRQGRLWTIDHAHHGWGHPRLLAFDLATGELIHRMDFPGEIAPLGSYLQDFAVDPQGKTLYIADVSFVRKRPALIVYDIEAKKARRVLERDPSVMPQDYLIHTRSGPLVRLGGLVAMKVGVDSIALDPQGEWLYYGAMNHGDLFKIRVSDLNDPGLTAVDLSLRKQFVGKKVLSDGITLDAEGNVYLTDVEHGAIARLAPDGNLQTLIRDERVRWPDGFSWGPEGWLYFTDSAIPEIAFRSRGHIKGAGPYYVFRIRPGPAGIPGH